MSVNQENKGWYHKMWTRKTRGEKNNKSAKSSSGVHSLGCAALVVMLLHPSAVEPRDHTVLRRHAFHHNGGVLWHDLVILGISYMSGIVIGECV